MPPWNFKQAVTTSGTTLEIVRAPVAQMIQRRSRSVLSAARARVVLAYALPARQACRPATMLAGMQVTRIAALGALTAAPAVGEK